MATANTANSNSLSTDFNVDPYYDDFDENKNFHRILFKPSLAVQARELTQTQSILQNQIDRFAEHIFKEGSTVSGIGLTFNKKLPYIRLRDLASDGVTAVDPYSFVGKTITGSSDGLTAYVVDAVDGSESLYPNTKTLYISYTGVGVANSYIKTFTTNETLTTADSISANTWNVGGSQLSNNVIRITYDAGIIYAKDHFIKVNRQSIIPNAYSSNVTIQLGYVINEEIVSVIEDGSLLDPARGTSNYNAPGADRLKLTATLTTNNDITTADQTNFIEMLRLNRGAPEQKLEKPQYSIINDYIAQRTYDESGDYIVSGLDVRLREHLKNNDNQGLYPSSAGGNANNLIVDIGPGAAYVKGYKIDNLLTKHIAITKGIDTYSGENLNIPVNIGNYLEVDEVIGSWNLDSGVAIKLYDTSQNGISNSNTSAFSTDLVTPVGAEIGSAILKAITHDAGDPGEEDTTYKFFMYNIQMEATKSFQDVRSVINDVGTPRGSGNLILNAANNAVLKESSFKTAVFKLGANDLKTLKNGLSHDVTYSYYKNLSSISGSGSFSISADDDVFPFTGGVLTDTQVRENFYIVSNSTVDSVNLTGQIATISNTTGAVVGDGTTAFTTELLPGDAIKVNSNRYVINEIITNNTANVHVVAGISAVASSYDYARSFAPGAPVPVSATAGRTITVSGDKTSATLNIGVATAADLTLSGFKILERIDKGPKTKDVVKNEYVQISGGTYSPGDNIWLGDVDVYEIVNIKYRSDGTDFTDANVTDAGVTDVTDQFNFNTGQTDYVYDVSYITLKNGSSLTIDSNTRLVVQHKKFEHVYVSGKSYFTIDSYSIDDSDPDAPSTILTSEIPAFISPTSGVEYDLRSSLDLRPAVTNDDSSAATINTATNIVLGTYTKPTGVPYTDSYLATPVANESFLFEYNTVYLPRKDRVVLTAEGSYRVIKGTPSFNPKLPPAPNDGLTLAFIDVAAFPSVPYEIARQNNIYKNISRINPVRQVRFTMKDIGTLKNRIDNLEYYTSLSLLETDTKNMIITDINGNERFKNGILVDQFTGHNVGNPKNPDYNISIHSEENELRPSFSIKDIPITYNAAASSNIERNGAYITLPILGHDVLVEQPYASNIRNATGLFYSWKGELTLNPDSDIWTDTTQAPDVQVNFDLNTDNWEELANSWGSEWQSWQTVNRDISRNVETARGAQGGAGGTFTNVSETTTLGQTRTGIKKIIVPETQTQSAGTSVRNVNLVPFMRSRLVNFSAVGLRPGATVYSFFDGQDVTDYCRPADSSFTATGAYGDSLVVNSNGETYGIFRIPNSSAARFRVGTKEFILTDNLFGRTGSGETTTFARDAYTASGLSQQVSETIISTRVPKIVTTTVSETRTTSNTNRSNTFAPDPLPAPAPPAVVAAVVALPAPTPAAAIAVAPAAPVQQFVSPPPAVEEPVWEDDDGDDPIAQTFTVDTLAEQDPRAKTTSGVFVTKIDLYFNTKDSVLPVSVQIRACDPSTNFITERILPFARIEVAAANVNVSDDASAVTTVTFPTPVFLKRDEQYAIVIKPVANSPNYSLFTARIGDSDIITGTRISSQPASGVFFASSNDRTWSPTQEEDLKYTMYMADFGTDKRATAQLWNEQRKYLSLNSVAGDFLIGDTVRGEHKLTLQSAITGVVVGDKLVGESSAAYGFVTSIDGTIYSLQGVQGTFSTGESVILDGTSNSSQLLLIKFALGDIAYFDGVTQENSELRLKDISGNDVFTDGMVVTDIDTNASANVVSIDSPAIDTIHTAISRIALQDTTVDFTGKFGNTIDTVDSTYMLLEEDDDTIFASRKYVLDVTKENLINTRSAIINVNMANYGNKRVTPLIDVDNSTTAVIENFINNDATGEAGTASGGNALARYITRTITLAENQDAEDLKVFLTAYKPNTADVKVYYKILNSADDADFESKLWMEMEQVTTTSLYSNNDNKQDFKEYEYRIIASELTGTAQDTNTVVEYTSDGVTYSGYKYFAIKIVLLSTSFSNVPRVKNLRAIAIQA